MKRGFTKLLGVCLALLPALAWAEFSFRTLGAPAEGISYAKAVSPDGKTVVGTANSYADPWRQFIWTEPEGFRLVPLLNGKPINVQAVSNNGVVTGHSGNYGTLEPFRWCASDGMESLGDGPGGMGDAGAVGIDAAGETIIGYGDYGWRWTRTLGMENLGDLPGGYESCGPVSISPDGSIITGTSSSGLGYESFSWTESTGMVGFGNLYTPQDASSDGKTLVGAHVYDYRHTQPFRWSQAGGLQLLGLLQGTVYGGATAVSGDGWIIVGSCDDGADYDRFFIWSPWTGMMEFEPFLRSKDTQGMQGWEIVDVQDISADGRTIVGEAYHYGENRLEAFIATIDRPGPRVTVRPIFRGGGG